MFSHYLFNLENKSRTDQHFNAPDGKESEVIDFLFAEREIERTHHQLVGVETVQSFLLAANSEHLGFKLP